MRMTVLFILALSLVYYFYPEKKNTTSQLDSIKVKMSAIRKANLEKTIPKPTRDLAFVEPEPLAPTETSSETEEASYDDESEPLQTAQLPVPDIDGGWKLELKDLLVRLEPEEGEAIYNAYVEEKDSYDSEMQSLQKEKDLAESDVALSRFDMIMTEVDQEHEEKIKRILGSHFDEVMNAHQEYMSAVNHLTQEPSQKPVY